VLEAGLVAQLTRLLGSEPAAEDRVLRFIAARYGARALFELPPRVATEIVRRPGDFLRAAHEFFEPSFKLETESWQPGLSNGASAGERH